MSDAVAITGIGMSRFGKHLDESLKEVAAPAITGALQDAGLEPDDVDMGFVANAMSGVITGQASVVGQSVLRAQGFSGIPVFNVDNACAGSSSALSLAVQAVRSGAARTVIVVGVEKLYHEDKERTFRALNGAADLEGIDLTDVDLGRESVFVKRAYPPRVKAYTEKYPLAAETLAEIAVKNRANAGKNPMAQYTKPLTLEEILESRMVVEPITALMCAPIGDGASAAIVTSADVARSDGARPVWVRASEVGMASRPGELTIARVAGRAYERAGIKPSDVDVAEVHDSIAFNELLAYEHLGFCGHGEGTRLVQERATSLGGSIPVNPSGGLESRGHPIAATGLAQIVELVTQLRGDGGERQVDDARIALAENAGGFAAGDTAALAITILGTEPGSD
jgi:acetyl-CoA acetyltransferase